jgi:hypothetical protein
MSDKLLTTLMHDAEAIEATALPNISDLPSLFSGLVTRLEAALPGLVEWDFKDLLAAAEAKATAAEAPAHGAVQAVHTTITQQPAPVQAEPHVQQVAPSESAGTAQGGAPSETLAARLRRQADELEAAEIGVQSDAMAATAAGAAGGPQVTQGGVPQATQDSSQ